MLYVIYHHSQQAFFCKLKKLLLILRVHFAHNTNTNILTQDTWFLYYCVRTFTWIKNLNTSSTAACCACSAFWIWRNPLSTGRQEQRALGRRSRRGLVSTRPHLLLLSLCHPSLPSPHMGFAFGWTLGFFHRGCRLPRESEPQKSWANVCGSLRVRRGLFILLFPPFFSSFLFLCSFFLALRPAPSTPMSEKITLICVSPVYYFPGRAAKTRPNKIWRCVLLTY